MADHLPGIGVDQKLVRVEAMARLGLIGAMHAIAIDHAGACIGQVSVPDLVRELRQLDPLNLALAGLVEDTEFDLGSVGGKQGEIDAKSVPGGA